MWHLTRLSIKYLHHPYLLAMATEAFIYKGRKGWR